MEDVKLTERIKHAWDVFRNGEQQFPKYTTIGSSSARRPDRVTLGYGVDRSIVSAVYNRIALDVASVNLQHVRQDQNGRYIEPIKSGLNECLTVEANIDQSGRAFIQDVAMSLFDEGCVAIVPVDTTTNPNITDSYDIRSMRTAKIVEWFPKHVRVNLYNDRRGMREDIIVEKKTIAIVENPFHTIMNEPNSTLKRLIRKLNLLDTIDDQSGAGKLDIIIQLPYAIKTESRRVQANKRKQEIEEQLTDSKYGIAYVDGTERITQLNRPAENNLMSQIEYLTSMLYSQLGLTESIFDGTADAPTVLNYYNRTIEPIILSIMDEMERKFLTKTARSQNQALMMFRDPFKLVPATELAEIVDKFTRNEVLSSNECRAIIGFKPSDDPEADELRNKNLNRSTEDIPEKNNQNGSDEELEEGDEK